MSDYPVGVDVAVTLPFIDLNGDFVTPTALSYVVTDGDEAILAGPTTIGDLSGSETIITVPASLNAVAGPRTVTLSITTSAGVFVQEEIYNVRPLKRVVRLTNSFQSYPNALYLADDIPGMLGWLANAAEARQVAMIEAYARLTRQNYIVRFPLEMDTMNIYIPDEHMRIIPAMWPLMTSDLFSRYPEVFRTALCKAQIVEANEILTGDPIASKRRSGLMSETVGESSMMFRAGPRPLDTGMSRAALGYLTGYLDNRITIARS